MGSSGELEENRAVGLRALVNVLQPEVLFVVLDGKEDESLAYIAMDAASVRALVGALHTWLSEHPERGLN